VSIDQRPAKKYFDRSALFHPLLDAYFTSLQSHEMVDTNMYDLFWSQLSWY